jgi:hypothetical protein
MNLGLTIKNIRFGLIATVSSLQLSRRQLQRTRIPRQGFVHVLLAVTWKKPMIISGSAALDPVLLNVNFIFFLRVIR